MTFVLLATGPSMSQTVANSVRGRAKVIAISDSYKLAPWADVLVSSDAAWWKAHAEALNFFGPKYGAMPDYSKIDGVERFCMPSGSNSGLLACHIAAFLGAKRILLCGFDMKGSHYFGPHPSPLRNTSQLRFDAFQKQFARFRPKGIEIINCTPGSALKCYPMANLNDCLVESAASAV